MLFFFSGIVALRQNYDLESYCDEKKEGRFIYENVMRDISTIDTKAPLHKLFISIEKMNYLGQLSAPNCHIYSLFEVFKYNYFVWTTGYFLGL